MQISLWNPVLAEDVLSVSTEDLFAVSIESHQKTRLLSSLETETYLLSMK